VIPGTSILDGSSGTTDPSGHGTWVAGIVAAQTDTTPLEGIAGVAYAGVRVMPVTVLDANGLGQDSDVIAGVIWAADHRADVIVMAFSNPGFSQNLQDALDYAWSKNVVLVAATGNDALTAPTFPAGDRGVMGVAGTDPNDTLVPFSSYGPSVFIAAPATDILTTAIGDAYSIISGTSASAAIVAGAAAFMKAVDPTLTNGIIVGRLARMADPAGTQDQTGNGRINMARALADTGTDFIEPAGAPPVGGGGPFVGPYQAAAISVQGVTVSAQTGTLTYGTGGNATYTVTIGLNGNNDNITINLSIGALPSGVTAGFNPAQFTNVTNNANRTSTLTLTTTATTPVSLSPGTAFTVTATKVGGGSASGNGALIVNKANSTTTIPTDLSAATVVGQGYSVTARVDPATGSGAAPSGTVTISDGTASCTTGALSSFTASCSLTSTSAGNKTITATYGGDGNYNGSSGTKSHTVNQAGTSTSLTSSANPSVFGQSVTFTATVSAAAPGSGTPSGTVTFNDGVTTLGTGTLNGSGVATFATSALSVATHSITAVYGGNTNFTPSTSNTVSQQVNRSGTSTSLTSSANPSVFEL